MAGPLVGCMVHWLVAGESWRRRDGRVAGAAVWQWPWLRVGIHDIVTHCQVRGMKASCREDSS